MSDRYDIREQIGKGGLGAVYKALDTQLQREVAIKRVLSPDQAAEEEVQEAAGKLMAEAQTLSSLNHPNIITVFDVGQDERGGFVVMELLKGETLDETVERGVLTQEDFTEVVLQTMEALITAQASDVIHRDIKPTNIMVIWQASGKFQLKILDFGLAKFSKAPSVQTMDQEDSVLGSIYFMAPEQFERGELDARTDLYQMGCVYYNALTGQYPFNGETAPQVMNAHLQHKVVPLDQIRPDLSPSICQWVMWLINRDMEHRPADARAALERWPRNPEPPGAVPVQALPVEDTPEVSTGDIKIVTADDAGAKAPPSLIVPDSDSAPIPGSRTGNVRAGSRTGAIRGGTRTGRLGPGGATNRRRSGSGNRTKLIVVATLVSAILIFVGIWMVNQAAAQKREDRVKEMAAAEKPVGSTSDIALAVDFLEDEEASASLRNDAVEALRKLDGTDIDQTILRELRGTESPSARTRLAEVLAARGHRDAVPAIAETFGSATTTDGRVDLLNALRDLAGPDDIGEILDVLSGDYGLAVRRIFEETVLAISHREGHPEDVVDELLDRISSTSGDARKSLFRILGAIGGEKVRTHVASIHENEDDPQLRRDAMAAYLTWRDRSVIPQVEEIIETADDKALQTAAERAFARLATLPGPQPIEEKIDVWNRAFAASSNPNDVRRLIGSVIEYPSPQSVSLLREWAKHRTHGGLAKGAVGTLRTRLNGLPQLGPGGELQGNTGRVQGDSQASIDSTRGSLTEWTSPETWFSWSFEAAKGGEFAVEVEQSYASGDSSEFEVYLGGRVLADESKNTGSWETFETVRLPGVVPLEAGEVYTLVLRAGDRIQSRMMDIATIRLVKP